MVRSAPRYDPRIREAVRALDDRRESMAEISRRVGVLAARLGLPRPSYVHLRTIIRDEREKQDRERARREELRAIAADVATDLVLGLRVDAYEVAERVREARREQT